MTSSFIAFKQSTKEMGVDSYFMIASMYTKKLFVNLEKHWMLLICWDQDTLNVYQKFQSLKKHEITKCLLNMKNVLIATQSLQTTKISKLCIIRRVWKMEILVFAMWKTNQGFYNVEEHLMFTTWRSMDQTRSIRTTKILTPSCTTFKFTR